MTDTAGTHPTAEIQLPIEGMTCASCVNRIERFLRKTEGVQDATVNLATETATIRYLPAVADRDRLVGAVEAAGYDVRIMPEPAPGTERVSLLEELSADDAARAREERTLLREAVGSIVVAVLIMVAMFVPQTSIPMETINWIALRPGHDRPGLGRTSVLPGRLARRPARDREYGHARGDRHVGGLAVQRGRDARAGRHPRGGPPP